MFEVHWHRQDGKGYYVIDRFRSRQAAAERAAKARQHASRPNVSVVDCPELRDCDSCGGARGFQTLADGVQWPCPTCDGTGLVAEG